MSLFVGYEIGTGKEVNIPIFHTLVTGQTQMSGKTTLMKTLAKQTVEQGYKVLVFDSVPGYTPVFIKDRDGIDILPIEDLYERSQGSENSRTSSEEVVKTLLSPIITLCANKRHEATWHGSIKQIVKHPYKGKIIRFNTVAGLIDVSPNHSVIKTYNGRGKEKTVDACKVVKGDILSFLPIYSSVQGRGNFFGNEKIAWLYGIFVAEGWVCKTAKDSRIHIANANPKILNEAKNILEENFNCFARISKHRGADTVDVHSKFVYDHFKRLCYTYFGKHAKGKRVPREILNAPSKIKRAFLEGYVAGDGHIGPYSIRFSTTSQSLAMGVIWLIQSVERHSWSLHIRDDKPDAIEAVFNQGTRNDVRPGTVKKIRELDYDGFLYDLVAEGDHTFCAGIGPIRVHNTKQNRADFDTFGEEIPICLRETTDSLTILWLLESIMRRKLSQQYATLTRCADGTKNFQEVLDNAIELEANSRPGFIKDAAKVLIDLLQRLIDQTKNRDTTPKLELKYPINRITMNKFSLEGQQMILKTAFEDALEFEKLIMVLDESSKFLPQKYHSACGQAINFFVTQGAVSGDFLWMSTQFLATTSKEQMKAMDVKILGRQSHDTECEHTLDLIPKIGGQKWSNENIMQLKLGHFVVVAENLVKTVYTVPEYADRRECHEVALGKREPKDIHYRYTDLLTADEVQLLLRKKTEVIEIEAPEPLPKKAETANVVKATLVKEEKTEVKVVEVPKEEVEKEPLIKRRKPSLTGKPLSGPWGERIELLEANMEGIRQRVVDIETSLQAGDSHTSVGQVHTQISLEKTVKQVKITDDTIRGKILTLAKEDFFKSYHPLRDVVRSLEDHHWTVVPSTVQNELRDMVEDQILGCKKQKGQKGEFLYTLTPNVHFTDGEIS
jgi:intein/homing endonuclease